MDQLPRLGKRELICLLLFTCNYAVSVWRGCIFLLVLWMGYVILLLHSLILPYNYIDLRFVIQIILNFDGQYLVKLEALVEFVLVFLRCTVT